jgi:hypothetical protein
MRSRSLKSLLLIALPYALFCTATAFAHKDRIQHPETTIATNGRAAGRIVTFPPDRTVRFTLGSSSAVTAITVQLGKSTFRVPPGTCAKIRAVQFDSVRLLWSGHKESPLDAGGFYIRFSAGSERERAFGQLPEYELFFRGDRFVNGRVKKQINRSTVQYFDF